MDRHKRKLLRRLYVLSAGGLVCGLIVAANLFSMQIIHGDEYISDANQMFTYTSSTPASRGDILDRNGETLVTNTTSYTLQVTYAFWDKDGQNERILDLVNMITKDEGTVNDALPVSTGTNGSYSYTKDEESSDYRSLQKYCENAGWGSDLSAQDVMDKLRTAYEIDSGVNPVDARKIAGVRYQMEQEQFSMYNTFSLASGISMDLVAKLSEQHEKYAGVEVQTASQREIKTDYAANILGYIGPIFAEDWDKYKEEGYSMNAQVGKTGAEQAFEEYLHGTDGKRAIQTDSRGNVISEKETEQAQSGNNVVLTLDINLQRVAEEALAERCQSIRGAGGGAAAVVDVRNGEILALANYPTYNLKTFNQDYEKLAENKLSPLLNRSIAGIYAPGSTFKVCTAVAGLDTGAIDSKTRINDTGVYDYYDAYHPKCWIYSSTGSGHGWEDVTGALEDSCNYFFFETGRLVGGDKLESYAKQFGLGEYTGLELSGEKKGRVAGPTAREEAKKNNPNLSGWRSGDTLQAAIGQGDNAYTPLQLANYCAAIATNGTLHEAHLLRSVKAYDYSETVYTKEATVLNQVKADESTWKLVHEGMAKVTGEDGTASSVFEDYPIKVAGKSGTAQITGTERDNGIFISYAPFDEPQIAVCVVIEGGDSGNNVAPVIRDIYNAYFFSGSRGDDVTDDSGNYDVIA